MRILVYPLIGLSNLQGDSDYIWYSDLIRSWVAKYPVYFYMVLPEWTRGTESELPNTEHIFVNVSKDFFEASMQSPQEIVELFNRRGGKKIFDLLFTTHVGGSAILQSQLSDFRRRNMYVPCVILESMVRAWRNPNDVDATIRAISYSLAHTWLLSTEERTRAWQLVKDVLQPSMVQKYLDNCNVIVSGVSVSKLDKIIAENPKYDKFTVFFGGRFSKEKRPDIMMDFVEHFFSYGRDVDIVCTTQHLSSRELLRLTTKGRGSSIVDLTLKCPRDKFWQKAVQSQVFICTSADESWPNGFFEQLYLTQIGLFPDRPWVRATLPDNYPFVFKSKAEGHAMLRWIYEHYDEALAKVSWIRDWVRENANWDIQMAKGIEWMRGIELPYLPLAKKTRKIGRTPMCELVLQAANECGDQFMFWDFIEKLAEKTASFDPRIQSRTLFPTRYELYRTLLDNGYRDTYDNPDVKIVKVI
jgi:hypothetical protein